MLALVKDDWRAEADVPPADTRRKGGDNSFFWSVKGETWWGKEGQLNTSGEDVKRRMFKSQLGGRSKGGFRLDATQRTNITENQQEN